MVHVVSTYFLVAIVSTGFFVTVVLVADFFEGRVQSLCSETRSTLTHLAGHSRFYGSTVGILG